MKTHIAEAEDGHESGVISYPSNEQETVVKEDVVSKHTETLNNVKQPKKKKAVKKTVASKPVASKPASSPASKPDPRGQRKSEQEHKEEWQGFFRD